MEQQFFPAPVEHSRRGRECSALEKESGWRTVTGDPALLLNPGPSVPGGEGWIPGSPWNLEKMSDR